MHRGGSVRAFSLASGPHVSAIHGCCTCTPARPSTKQINMTIHLFCLHIYFYIYIYIYTAISMHTQICICLYVRTFCASYISTRTCFFNTRVCVYQCAYRCAHIIYLHLLLLLSLLLLFLCIYVHIGPCRDSSPVVKSSGSAETPSPDPKPC